MRLNWILWFSVVSVYKECLRAPWNRPGIPARHWALSRGSGRRRPRACVRRATHASLRHHRRPSIARSLHYDAPPSPSDLAMDSTATVIAQARERPPPLYAAGDSARITRWRHGSHADAISMPVRIHPISIHNKTHIIQRLYANTDYSKSPSTVTLTLLNIIFNSKTTLRFKGKTFTNVTLSYLLFALFITPVQYIRSLTTGSGLNNNTNYA